MACSTLINRDINSRWSRDRDAQVFRICCVASGAHDCGAIWTNAYVDCCMYVCTLHVWMHACTWCVLHALVRVRAQRQPPCFQFPIARSIYTPILCLHVPHRWLWVLRGFGPKKCLAALCCYCCGCCCCCWPWRRVNAHAIWGTTAEQRQRRPAMCTMRWDKD